METYMKANPHNSMAYNDTTVLLPAHNESENLPSLISTIYHEMPGVYIVVVDSASTDDTLRIARNCGVYRVMRGPIGKGRAVLAGLRFIRQHCSKRPYTIMIDADLSYSPEDLPPVVSMLRMGHHAVVGHRNLFCTGSSHHRDRSANLAMTCIANLLFDTTASDICSGCWGFDSSTVAFLASHLSAPDFRLEMDIFTLLTAREVVPANVDIRYLPRGGTRKIRTLDGVRIGLFMLSRRLRFTDLRRSLLD